jgi:hypothetical protein
LEKCRREYSRIDVSWPVSIYTTAGLIDGELKNISIGGALINCRTLPDLDETFHLTIEIPDYLFPVAAKVKKVRLNVFDSDSDSKSPSYDLAIRFMDMSLEDRKVFHEAIDQAFRTEHRPPSAEKKAEPKASNRIDDTLLTSVEQLSTDLRRSFKDLLEEALQDLIHKYGKEIPKEDQPVHLEFP